MTSVQSATQWGPNGRIDSFALQNSILEAELLQGGFQKDAKEARSSY
jgi:hypothetical protein